jgi:hypothetical protein
MDHWLSPIFSIYFYEFDANFTLTSYVYFVLQYKYFFIAKIPIGASNFENFGRKSQCDLPEE